MAPDRIGNTNMWNVHKDEYFVDDFEGEVDGPMAGARVTVYPQVNKMTVQHRDRLYQLTGTDFKFAVKKREVKKP